MSYGTSSFCVLCGNHPGVTSCDGCQRKFCFECLTEHRKELSLELDDLFNRRNELVETINNQTSNKTTGISPCFDEIDRWRTEMHANIDRIASTARDNVRQFLSEASKNVRNELEQVSHDLQQRQKSGGYLEGDLNRIKQQLNKLNDIVRRFSEQIRIDASNSRRIDWDSLLFVAPNRDSQIHNTAMNFPQSPNLNSFTASNRERHMNTAPTNFPQSPNMNSFAASNRERQTNTIPTNVPQSPMSNNFYNQQLNGRMSMPNNQFYTNTLPHTSTSHSTNNQRPPGGRSASVSMGSRPLTYTCIGCKSMNQMHENGPNVCSTCRCPAPF